MFEQIAADVDDRAEYGFNGYLRRVFGEFLQVIGHVRCAACILSDGYLTCQGK